MSDTIEDGYTVYTFDPSSGFYRAADGTFYLPGDPALEVDTDCCQ